MEKKGKVSLNYVLTEHNQKKKKKMNQRKTILTQKELQKQML